MQSIDDYVRRGETGYTGSDEGGRRRPQILVFFSGGKTATFAVGRLRCGSRRHKMPRRMHWSLETPSGATLCARRSTTPPRTAIASPSPPVRLRRPMLPRSRVLLPGYLARTIVCDNDELKCGRRVSFSFFRQASVGYRSPGHHTRGQDWLTI